jgi:hypothetical protein
VCVQVGARWEAIMDRHEFEKDSTASQHSEIESRPINVSRIRYSMASMRTQAGRQAGVHTHFGPLICPVDRSGQPHMSFLSVSLYFLQASIVMVGPGMLPL